MVIAIRLPTQRNSVDMQETYVMNDLRFGDQSYGEPNSERSGGGILS